MRIPIRLFRTLALLTLLPLIAGCDNFESPTDAPAPSLAFQAVLAPLGAEVHIVTIANDGVATVSLDSIEAQEVDDNFDDSGLGLTVRLARLDNNCEDGAAFGMAEGQRVVFDLAATSYCINVSEPGLLPENALLAYSLGVTLPE